MDRRNSWTFEFNYEQGTNNFDKHYNIMLPWYLLAISKNESDQA